MTKRFRAGEIDLVDDFASEQIDFLKRELPKETRIAPYLGTYYYVVNLQAEAVRRSEGAAGAVAGDRSRCDHRQGAEDRRAAGIRRRAAEHRRLGRPATSPNGSA